MSVLAAIGVMSGTSMDGIDVAMIRSDGEGFVEASSSASFAYPEEVAAELRAVVADVARARGPLVDLERAVTDAHVAAVEQFLERFEIDRREIAVIGLHGQTVLHRPREKYSRQLCDGARAAARLGIDVACDSDRRTSPPAAKARR